MASQTGGHGGLVITAHRRECRCARVPRCGRATSRSTLRQHLRDRGRPAGDPARLAIPLAGENDEAKRAVAGLIDQLGFDPVDTGKLADAGAAQEPGTPPFGATWTADELRRHVHG